MIAVQFLLVAGLLALIVTVAVVVGIIIDCHCNRIGRQLDSVERLIKSSESIIRAAR